MENTYKIVIHFYHNNSYQEEILFKDYDGCVAGYNQLVKDWEGSKKWYYLGPSYLCYGFTETTTGFSTDWENVAFIKMEERFRTLGYKDE